MASVFLSYDHEDAKRPSPIVAALERAGHSVWWDQHIRAGSEYNHEIEGAVERADAVVVLRTERSVRSAWVRDEAADFCFEPDLPYDCEKEAAKLQA